jgi:uncharacterized membrane protein HdeD (DUF308 family)
METTDSRHRIKKLWIFILISGLLHFYVGVIYVTTDLIRYLWLTKVFIVATIANGLSEIIFFWIKYKHPYERRLPASLYDIVLGVILVLYPFYTMLIFPLFVAGELLIRGITELNILRTGAEEFVLDVKVVRTFAWIRIILAIMILLYTVIDPSIIWLSGLAFGMGGLALIATAIKLRQIK